MKEKIEKAYQHIINQIDINPEIGIILGTGLGSLVNEIKEKTILPYQNIPYFLTSTVETHQNQLIFGKMENKNIIAMQGRFHYYEGYSPKDIVFPIYVMKSLGVKTLIISNAAGGLNPLFSLGDLMIITDHINLMGINPLIGHNDEKIGPRFPDMFNAYNKDLISLIEKVALDEKIKIQKGVYVGVAGPNLETAAEYRFLRLIGADTVGMSTISEVIAARHIGLNVLGISCITDICLPDNLKALNFKEVVKVSNETEPKLTNLLKKFIAKF